MRGAPRREPRGARPFDLVRVWGEIGCEHWFVRDDGRPVRLTDRFVTQTAIGAPDGG